MCKTKLVPSCLSPKFLACKAGCASMHTGSPSWRAGSLVTTWVPLGPKGEVVFVAGSSGGADSPQYAWSTATGTHTERAAHCLCFSDA